MAWSSDGKFLAAAGGVPGQAGEVVLFDTQAWKPVRTLTGHTEVVYAVAWKPNSRELATGSLDKTACIWDGATGKVTHVIKDHAEGVMGVAYSPDGKMLATGSLDRSAKIFDTSTWKRLAALTAHQDGVTRVAFNQNGTRLATAGLDRTVRVWTIKTGTMENPDRTMGEGDTVNACVFSPDGSLLVWGASNNVVKVFNGDGTQQKREMKEPPGLGVQRGRRQRQPDGRGRHAGRQSVVLGCQSGQTPALSDAAAGRSENRNAGK